LQPASNIHAVCCLWDSGHIGLGPFRVWNNMQREEMGIVNENTMGVGISMVGEWEWEGMGV